MPILARQTAGSELERSRILLLAEPRDSTDGLQAWRGGERSCAQPFTRWMHGQTCMTNIGATAISTHATMITSSAAAMDFFSIRLHYRRSRTVMV